MATRRSRLQIKPNIGGPKGPVAKTPTPNKPPTNEKISKDTNKEPISSPKQEANAESQKVKPATSTELPVKEKEDQNDVEKNQTEDSLKPQIKESENDVVSANDKPDIISSPPSRARLRRFGKVNLTGIISKSPDTNSQKCKDSKDITTAGGNASTIKDKANDSMKTSGDDAEVSDSKSEKSSTEESKSVTRRSRFPKAKPNVIDAGKRRQKQSESTTDQEDSTKNSTASPNKPSVPVPSIVVSPPEESADLTPQSTPQPILATPEPMQMTQIQPRPPMPRSPIKTPVSPAVLMSPVKQLHGAADKRQRTVSVSEPPVKQRAKKPKIDAPTDKPPDRTTMKMRDLIHWNPKNNPMKPKVKKGEGEIVAGVEKENVEKDKSVTPDDVTEDSNSTMPVPQVTIGPDGNIVINEQSLVVKNPEDEKGSDDGDKIIDETDMITTYRSFRKVNNSKRWSNKETAKFYKALGMIGIDFFLIGQLFPNRSRFEIKQKFKTEEKKNKPLVDKVLRERIQFDPTAFDNPEEVLSSEEEEIPKKETKKRGRKKKVVDAPAPKKKPTKRLKKPMNYFDESHSEEEGEPINPAAKMDSPWQPPSVSQKDGEVVGILMDMSKGRLSADGVHVENVMQADDMASNDMASEPVATPCRTSPHIQKGLPGQNVVTGRSREIERTTNVKFGSPNSTASTSREIVSSANNNSPVSVSSINSNRVVLNSPGRGMSPVQFSRPIVQPVPPRIRTYPHDAGVQAELEENQTLRQTALQETSNFADDTVTRTPLSMTPQAGLSLAQCSDQQYVLVTVVPEGGEETVIHIYKLHTNSDGLPTIDGDGNGTPPIVDHS